MVDSAFRRDEPEYPKAADCISNVLEFVPMFIVIRVLYKTLKPKKDTGAQTAFD